VNVEGMATQAPVILSAQPHSDGSILFVSPGGHVPILVTATWVRDHCGCPECLQPNGQRLFDVSNLPEDPRVERSEVVDGRLFTTFQPDGHIAMLSPSRVDLLLEDSTLPMRARGQ
jgi:hypothetical protein